ncbi:MAG: tRNA pseudouridine(55) synthase TruB [Acidobacteriaceae bacterium]|nr:tRNA pseudouridine(55) synthase TruB [Acidobacteriaceae bacterium]MBV9781972.1 tRNA pseudouridine(55) synthase TruB [Acidobacteriaceae bacterium]
MNGLVLIDKPSGCTSHDVVNRWRKLASTKRVGHLGTLDPMATGLLALLTGPATRLAQYFGNHEKTYVAEITLGMVSDTYDLDGIITQACGPVLCDLPHIERALDAFRGRIQQTPPPVSAKKISGVPAYKLARKHVAVELEPVEVEIYRLQIQSFALPRIEVLVSCSAGTYVRALAHDLGQKVGCGAVLSKLRRIQSGEFTIEQARTLEQFTEIAAAGRLCDAIIPAARLLSHIPEEHFGSSIEAQIRQGRDFRTSPFVVPPGASLVKALSQSGELIAIGELRIPNVYHPVTVL